MIHKFINAFENFLKIHFLKIFHKTYGFIWIIFLRNQKNWFDCDFEPKIIWSSFWFFFDFAILRYFCHTFDAAEFWSKIAFGVFKVADSDFRCLKSVSASSCLIAVGLHVVRKRRKLLFGVTKGKKTMLIVSAPFASSCLNKKTKFSVGNVNSIFVTNVRKNHPPHTVAICSPPRFFKKVWKKDFDEILNENEQTFF